MNALLQTRKYLEKCTKSLFQLEPDIHSHNVTYEACSILSITSYNLKWYKKSKLNLLLQHHLQTNFLSLAYKNSLKPWSMTYFKIQKISSKNNHKLFTLTKKKRGNYPKIAITVPLFTEKYPNYKWDLTTTVNKEYMKFRSILTELHALSDHTKDK